MAQAIVVPPDDPRGKLAVMNYRVLGKYIADPSHHGEAPAATWAGRVGKALAVSSEPDLPGQDGRAMYSWLEIDLETGRTHQIRVQVASRGHPVVGDAQYGSTQPFGEQFQDERLRAIALHAHQLGFNHPMTGEPVNILAPPPAAWNSVVGSS
jgi:23S rRNA pseudouridine1911/1915/1917 synthase